MLTTTIPRTTATADRFRVETWQLDHQGTTDRLLVLFQAGTARTVEGAEVVDWRDAGASVREGTDLGAVIAAAAASLGVKPEAFYAAIKAALYAVGQADGLLPSGADVTVK
jgi:hypothetical protein